MTVFNIEIIKPSHYDREGYVIQWWKAWIPSNSMACLYAIASECADRRVLGEDVAIEVDAYDEMNIKIPVDRIAQRITQPGHDGIVLLVGVQSNQFPRAMAIARRFRASGVKVAMGGFHVSGVISMLKELTPELRQAVDLGVTLFAGEAEVHISKASCATCMRARRSQSMITCTICPICRPRRFRFAAAWRGVTTAFFPHSTPGAAARFNVRSARLLTCKGEIALSRRRRHRAHRALQRRPGHFALFRDGRQFRPQSQLGGDFRSNDRIAREGLFAAFLYSGRYARPQDSPTSSTKRRSPAAVTPPFIGLRASIPTISSI